MAQNKTDLFAVLHLLKKYNLKVSFKYSQTYFPKFRFGFNNFFFFRTLKKDSVGKLILQRPQNQYQMNPM